MLEIILSITGIVANLAVVVTMIFAIKAFRASIEQTKVTAELNRITTEQNKTLTDRIQQDREIAKVQLERQKKSDTMLFANEIIKETDAIFADIRKVFKKETINLSEPRYDEELKAKVTAYLRLMERLAVGMNTGLYDLDIYARMCRTKTIKAWKQLENVVEAVRKQDHSAAYEEFEHMVDELKAWKKHELDSRGNVQELS